MADIDPKVSELEARLDSLVRTQIDFQKEISTIRRELTKLRTGTQTQGHVQQPEPERPVSEPHPQYVPPNPEPTAAGPEEPPGPVAPPTFGTDTSSTSDRSQTGTNRTFSDYVTSTTDSARGDLEKFIGENLISKVGILILVLGVGIGTKYAIDNGWISPLLRMVFGYVTGCVLLGLAVRLKPKYLNFSAVLLSGGIAILYFVTYFGYAYYSLMPLMAAFFLMVIFTVFTVVAAIFYDRPVIAHIGLVGAYAVPFLLSTDSGNYAALFTYMAIINAGILAIGVKKSWKSLFYTASGFTWLIYFGWFITKYTPGEHFYLALVFLAVFFALFYTTKILHGVVHSDVDDAENFFSILATGFIFYSFVFAISNVDATGRAYAVLFAYLVVISLTILFTSYHFYGRVLVYLSYPFVWLIFGTWFANRYNADEHFVLAAVFASVFFSVYYVATIVYRIVTDDIGLAENAGLLLTNSFIFYGFGFAIMDSRESLRGFEGVFTIANAGFHLLVANAVGRIKESAVDVVQVLTILIITFATIAVPVQLDGNYVTLVWTVEAAMLFWFGRARQIPMFEYLSYPLMVLASGSMFLDWLVLYSDRTMYISQFNRNPVANGDFITALVFVAGFAFIFVTNKERDNESAIGVDFARLFGIVVASVGLFVLYNAFRIEISNYFHLELIGSEVANRASSLLEPSLNREADNIVRFNFVWQLNYTMLFLIAIGIANLRKVRSATAAAANSALSVLVLIVFATAAMYVFYELRIAYMVPGRDSGSINIAIRFVSYIFAAGLLYSLFRNKIDDLLADRVPPNVLNLGFDAVFYATVFVTASWELLNLMAQFHILDGRKLGLSILWGVYALSLIAVGIAWNKKHLRIAAIVLLAVTLVKLFLYDVANLPTIQKTILFVSLGILMLIVSFLYNKYKSHIFGANAVAGE